MSGEAVDQATIREILSAAKVLAARYFALTGKPLGVTGEVAEFEAADKLGLTLAPPRYPDYDGFRNSNGRTERHQIKGRAVDPSDRYRGRVPSIEYDREFDSVTLVLLDRSSYSALEIWQASREAVRDRLQAPGSKARNERNSMAISQFISIARKIWPEQCRERAANPAVRNIPVAQQKMTREEAISRAARHCRSADIRASTTHFSNINASKNVWWLDIPGQRITNPTFTTMHFLLYDGRPNRPEFHHLAVPIMYIRQSIGGLRIRTDNNKVSLELSAETSNLFQDVIGTGRVSFGQFAHCQFSRP